MPFLKRLRKAAEIMSRGIMIKRRLPLSVGGAALYVSPESALSYWKFKMEDVHHELLEFAQAFVREGYSAWDLGANLGVFSFAAAGLAKKAGFVLAVEPDIWLANILQCSCRLLSSRQACVRVLCVAVTDNLGISELYIARNRSSNVLAGSNRSTEAGGARELQQAIHVSVDWLSEYFPAPQVMKIDVEGHEAHVLRGALKTLQKHQPFILIEVWENNAEEVTELLHGLEYDLYDVTQSFGCCEPIPRATFSTLALPRSS
ncbi:MAG: FkbM family methyltransferase [Deltaproteobacteria bacterium]|nr:FkbM family methyltransferase [Deltaproteobacteria bacterium]